ncbi:MAG: hypothetical protein ACR2OM_15655, partial [Aestuariivirgaceae bacterium]
MLNAFTRGYSRTIRLANGQIGTPAPKNAACAKFARNENIPSGDFNRQQIALNRTTLNQQGGVNGMTVTEVAANKCFGGKQGVYSHNSSATGTAMTFAVYEPPQADYGPVPVLWYLSGLTCTHEKAMVKA